MNTMLVMVDIDGCIVDARARYKKAGPEPKGSKTSAAYNKWVKTVMSHKMLVNDAPVPGMLDILGALHAEGHAIAYVTSREEIHREITKAWLMQHGFWQLGDDLLMRPIGNLLPDHELKEMAIETLKDLYRPDGVVVMDDDLRGGMAEMCKRKGFTMLKVQGFSL